MSDPRAAVARVGGNALSTLLSLPGHSLLALDSIKRGSTRTSTALPESPPTGVFVTIAHWRPSSEPVSRLDPAAAPDAAPRLRHLLDCLRSALELSVDRVEIAITTTAPTAVAADLLANAAQLPGRTEVELAVGADRTERSAVAARRVVVFGWSPGLRRNPYYLTWAHKKLMRSALVDPGFSHFIYLEDDIRFTDSSLEYWCRFRAPLAHHGLIPGFCRVESSDESCYVIDQLDRARCTSLPAVSIPSSAAGSAATQTIRFVNLLNPYQAMYVLDRPLAVEHFERSPTRDPIRSRAFSHWAIRERSAIGPIFDDVPAGFDSRNVVPVLPDPDRGWRLDPQCLLEHLAGNYTRGTDEPPFVRRFGSIALEDLFIAESQPAATAG